MSPARSLTASDEVSDEAILFLLFTARIVFCYFRAKAEDFLARRTQEIGGFDP
jgi:hypothetical protein